MTALAQHGALQVSLVGFWVAVLALLVIGVTAASRRTATFTVADRKVSPLLTGLATSAAVLSAAPFAALAGLMFMLGSDGLAWIIGPAAGLVLMGVLIVPAFRASGVASVPEFLAQRYGGSAVPRLAAALVVLLCFVLLNAQFAAIAALARSALDLPEATVVLASAVVIGATIVTAGVAGATRVGAVAMIVALLAFMVPLTLIALAKHGVPVGHLAYGETLQQVRQLEIGMISERLADAMTLKPHLRPFLQIDYVNTLALIACLIAGTAALPHIVMRSAVTAGVREARMGMAWTLLFAAVMLSAIPAYAAFTKHELYSAIAKGIPIAELPEIFARDEVSVHGVPLKLFHAVIGATNEGASTVSAVDERLQRQWPDEAGMWAALKPQVKGVLMTAAQSAQGSSYQQRFETWRATILPVAATASGNKTGKLTQGGVQIAPEASTVFGLRLGGLSHVWITLFALGGLVLAIAAGMATAWAIALAIGRDVSQAASAGEGFTLWIRLAGGAAVAAAAVNTLYGFADLASFAAWAFSLAAAGLFPALVLGIWWRGTTRQGAIAGILSGLLMTFGYIGGTHFMPEAFVATTGGLSDAGAAGVSKVANLRSIADKASAETKASAEAAVLSSARGTPVKAGAANWFGIHNSSAALFGMPLAFFVTILISLFTRPPQTHTPQPLVSSRRPTEQQ